MPRSIGYARCSTTHQDTDAQVTELRSAGCEEVFAEKVSSRAPLEKRPQLRACLESLQVGDELVVSKLDRLGRSQVEVINRLSDLQTKGIYVRSLGKGIKPLCKSLIPYPINSDDPERVLSIS